MGAAEARARGLLRAWLFPDGGFLCAASLHQWVVGAAALVQAAELEGRKLWPLGGDRGPLCCCPLQHSLTFA